MNTATPLPQVEYRLLTGDTIFTVRLNYAHTRQPTTVAVTLPISNCTCTS